MQYTTIEKLLAERVELALADLISAHDEMRAMGWHKVDDRPMRLVYLGVHAAITAQNLPLDAAVEIRNAEWCPQIMRLEPWDGYPSDEIENPMLEKAK